MVVEVAALAPGEIVGSPSRRGFLKAETLDRQMAKAKPSPNLRVALYSYGHTTYDANKGWVRKELDLTNDLDRDFQIVARTDSRAVRGFEEAIERAHAFMAAGADVTFVEAPVSIEELATIGKLPVPQVANMVFGGLTPAVSQSELARMGFGAVLYANAALQAALKSVRDVLGSLKANGSLDQVREHLASFDERQRAVDKDRYDALEARYRE